MKMCKTCRMLCLGGLSPHTWPPDFSYCLLNSKKEHKKQPDVLSADLENLRILRRICPIFCEIT